jgi:hypothetical protein
VKMNKATGAIMSASCTETLPVSVVILANVKDEPQPRLARAVRQHGS